jgi:agmatinase
MDNGCGGSCFHPGVLSFYFETDKSMNSIPLNFFGLDLKYCDYKKSRYVVLPVPYDSTVSYRTGSREGPFAILTASRQVELFDPKLKKEIHLPGIFTADPVETDTRGPKEMNQRLFKIASKFVRDGKFLLSLGGEHSISSALIQAVKTRHKKVSVLHVDAHLDMRDSWQGSPYSHASVIRRVQEMGIKTVSVGIRNISHEEHNYLSKNHFPVFTAEQICLSGDDDWMEEVSDGLTEQVYLSIDIDGFDPAFAPGTGTPEPGGLDWYQITKLLNLLAENHTIVGADIVEVLPIAGQAVTEFLAAKLAARIIALTQ